LTDDHFTILNLIFPARLPVFDWSLRARTDAAHFEDLLEMVFGPMIALRTCLRGLAMMGNGNCGQGFGSFAQVQPVFCSLDPQTAAQAQLFPPAILSHRLILRTPVAGG
jgi:hypothetical protein